MEIKDEIKLTEFTKVCRTCLSTKSDMKSVFESAINEMIMACTSVQVEIFFSPSVHSFNLSFCLHIGAN